MPVAFVIEAEEATEEDYNRVMDAIGHEELGPASHLGLIAHMAGPTPTGWRIIDIWESEEAARSLYGSDLLQSLMSQVSHISLEPWPLYRVEAYQTIHHVR